MADFLNTPTLPESTTMPKLAEVGRLLERADQFMRVVSMAVENNTAPEAGDVQALAPVINEAVNAIWEAKIALGLEARGEA